MSRGQEYTPVPEKRLPSITQDEVDVAGLDYAKWRRERHAKGIFGSQVNSLWEMVKEDNAELGKWLEPLLKTYQDADSQEGEFLQAAFAVMYDLLRRRGVGQIMNQGYFSSSAVAQVLPKSPLDIPQNPSVYALLVQDRAKFGRMAMEHEQDHEWVLKKIWELLPDVLDIDLTAYNSDTMGHLRSLMEWGARVMYGCLRQQLEQK